MNRQRPRHRFTAHLCDAGPHARQWVAEADSFIDAAVRFAETCDVGEGEAQLIVHDCETGRERCFRLDFGTGEIRAG
jgi:hypothetical protein